MLTNFAEATRILKAYRRWARDGKDFEIVEVVEPGSQPAVGTEFLGYDIALDYSDSRLVQCLQEFAPRVLGATMDKERSVSRLIYEVFAPKLNTNCLFDDAQVASWCEAAMEALNVISPGFVEFGAYQVCGLYAVHK